MARTSWAAIVTPRTCNHQVCSLSIHRVKDLCPGFITTFAGTGAAGAAGNPAVATAGELHTPAGMALDAAGSLYIADPGAHRIRKVSRAGQITTVAGTGNNGYAGDAADTRAAARFNGPAYALHIWSLNAVIISDTDNHRVRKIDMATGVVSTIAGDGTQAHGGDAQAAPIGSARLAGRSGLLRAPQPALHRRYGQPLHPARRAVDRDHLHGRGDRRRRQRRRWGAGSAGPAALASRSRRRWC